jgi:Xaa-Pro aminopeptidase
MNRFLQLAVLIALPVLLLSQEGVPLFTQDFPPQEFAARREKIYAAIGDGLAILQGAPSPPGYTRFRQSNEFYYVCGIEVPHAYLLMDGASKRTSLYLLHRNESRERSEGKLLSAEDTDLTKSLSGVDAVYPIEMLAEHLGRSMRSRNAKIIYTPLQPPEGFAMSRDLAVRANTDAASDPWDGTMPRPEHFIHLLKTRFPLFEIKDLSPILDELRLIKSQREIVLIKKSNRLSGLALIESMRSTQPGGVEFELDAVAKYVYYRNGAQGEAYYSLIASGPNAMVGHYNAGKRTMKDGDFLLMDFGPDVGYYMSDLTRMFPVNGKFNSWQRELYGVYLGFYKAILNNIKPGKTAQEIKKEAVKEMEKILGRSKFSKPIYENAAKTFVENYTRSNASPYSSLGHWVGMSTHDVGWSNGPLKAGMVFTIEPGLRVPEESINIRNEDMILITEKGAEILSSFVPMEMDEIEKVMAEQGMVQRYPMDGK